MSLLGRLIRWIIITFLFRYIQRIACLHFCKFKQNGSDMKYVHVHILLPNDAGVTGVGHDDHTNDDDAKHNTVSRESGSCEFKKRHELGLPVEPWPMGLPHPDRNLETIYPKDFGQAFLDVYFTSAPENREQPCPPGFFRVHCDCGDACMTFSHEDWERWHDSLPR